MASTLNPSFDKAFFTASSSDASVTLIALSQNGTLIPNTIRLGSAGDTESLSGQYLITAAEGDTIGVETTNTSGTTYVNTQLIVQKVD